VRQAEAAPMCPVTVRIAHGPGHSSDTPTLIKQQFESVWPGTNVQLQQKPSLQSINLAITSAGADVGLLSTPFLAGVEIPAVAQQWEVSAGIWIALQGNAARNRIDNSDMVRADDLVNYLRSTSGKSFLSSTGRVPNALHNGGSTDPRLGRELGWHDIFG